MPTIQRSETTRYRIAPSTLEPRRLPFLSARLALDALPPSVQSATRKRDEGKSTRLPRRRRRRRRRPLPGDFRRRPQDRPLPFLRPLAAASVSRPSSPLSLRTAGQPDPPGFQASARRAS
uniref:Uncharacterized protein n=1 Tax=Oryza rufipogon TaxID=4529 RepID=A0A0E0NDA1_ORYRU